jgi:hypothetical protein
MQYCRASTVGNERRHGVTKVLLVLLLTLAMISAAPARAQEPTPEPGPDAAKMLPDATGFGDGWLLNETVNPDLLARFSFEMTPDVFREGAAGIYVGPNGSRIVVVSLLITENRVAIRQSWEDATKLLDAVRTRTTTDFTHDQTLETMEAPNGCVEAKRIEGIENIALLPAGGTMCAIDPDVILIAVVLGDYADQSGVAASDAVIGVVLGT